MSSSPGRTSPFPGRSSAAFQEYGWLLCLLMSVRFAWPCQFAHDAIRILLRHPKVRPGKHCQEPLEKLFATHIHHSSSTTLRVMRSSEAVRGLTGIAWTRVLCTPAGRRFGCHAVALYRTTEVLYSGSSTVTRYTRHREAMLLVVTPGISFADQTRATVPVS